MKYSQGLAFVACFVALVGCQVAASAGPSNPATPAGSPSATASATASPVPTGLVLAPSGGAITDASFNSVISTSDGFLAAGSSDNAAVIAAGSADGLSWQALAADGVFQSAVSGIAVGPLGWVAAEQFLTPDGAGVGTVLWHSNDGRSWFRVPDQADLGTSYGGPVYAGAWGFGMLGQADDGTGSSAPRLWVSRDGLEWRQMPPFDWFGGQVVLLPNGFLAIGPERSAITTDGTSWVDSGPLPADDVTGVVAAAPLGADVLALFTGAPGGSVWRGTVDGPASQPSVTWRDAGLDLTPAATLVALATGPLGALVLGFDRKTLRPISWASADGRTWHRADLDESAFGGGVPTTAAVGQRAFVVLGWFGNEGGDLVARPWISTDGLAWEGTQPEQLGVLPGLPSESCPSSDPTEVAQLIAMADSYPSIPAAAWPYCFQDRELVLRGYVADCGGCGGETPYVATPSWLLSPLGYAQFWLLGSTERGLSISVQIDPRHPVTVPDPGAHVRVTGHFDDAAAQQCRLFSTEPGDELPSLGRTIATCRQEFVVTAIKVLTN